MDVPTKERTVIERVLDTALIPVQAAVSPPARKAYLRTVLFAATSVFLLGISSVAYALLYYNYVPQVGIERAVHLQFGSGHPHGLTSLVSALTSLQRYDIKILLRLPRTPTNLAAGNFMLDLALLSSDVPSSVIETTAAIVDDLSASILARSRRPAILTYTSPIVGVTSIISGLPWYVLGWKDESEILEVDMFEGVEFPKGRSKIPQSAALVIQAKEKMQFYEARIKITARLRGLRYILYNHRILSFLFFTTAFWTSSLCSALIVWLFLSSYKPSPSSPPTSTKPNSDQEYSPDIKIEPPEFQGIDPFSTDDLSDSSRTFPALSHPLSLQFPKIRDPSFKQEGVEEKGKNQVKMEEGEEEEDEEEETPRFTEQPAYSADTTEADADDENEDSEYLNPASWRELGIETNLDDEEQRERVQRRRVLFHGQEDL